jgi:nucleoside-diphosphate-sugar epimerase
MAGKSKSLRVLLIGGSGFVSGTLARSALAQGHKVWAVTRGQKQLPAGVTGLAADRHDEKAFAQAVEAAGTHWDLVVDCIGYEVADVRQDVSVFRNRAAQFVFVSTDSVFDPAHRRFPQGEETDHYMMDDGYGGKKRRCELELVNGDTGDMQWTVVRPCHIYGPGSLLGCLPLHSRDGELISRLKSGEALRLVGGGHFLQQPIFARDLAELVLSAAGNRRAYGQIFCTAGPDIIESRYYYQIVADALGVGFRIEEVPVGQYRAEHPERASFLCHRIFSQEKVRSHGLKVPSTPIEQGLREHVESLLAEKES